MAFVADDILLSDLILTFGPSIIDTIGGFFSGQVEQENFEKELNLKGKQLDAQISAAADSRKVDREQLAQSWKQFVEDLKFKKESENTRNVLKILEPEFEQSRRRKNILKSFSALRKGGAPAPTTTTLPAGVSVAPQNALAP